MTSVPATGTSQRRGRRATPSVIRGLCAAALIVGAIGATPALAAPSRQAPVATVIPRTQPVRTDTQADLDAARSHAQQLRDQLDQIEARQEWANERLAYVQNQLAGATIRSTLAEQQLDALAQADSQARADVGHRVSAIEQSGGVAPLYLAALDGGSLSDVAANIAALQSVMANDVSDADQADVAATQAAALHKRLDEVATQHVQLAKQARHFSDKLAGLAKQQHELLNTSTRHVRSLAKQLARERQAEQDAQTPLVPPDVTGHTSTPYAKPAVAAALSKLGSPYVWGAEGPDTFDCSGLVQWSYMQAGLVLPRLASDQYFASTPVPYSDIEPGDLIVYAYNTSNPDTIHHVTMYIGNGLMVEAPHTGAVVRISPVYQDGLYGVARPGL